METVPTRLDKGIECGREDCVTCLQEHETKLNCFARSVVYQSTCITCHKDGGRMKDNGGGIL